MTSIYLVRSGDKWLNVWEHGRVPRFESSTDGAHVFRESFDAIAAADVTYGEPVEFREVPKGAVRAVVRHVERVAPLPLDEFGDTAAGALAAAEATIARLRDELEQLRNRPSTHELAKRFLEATDG